MTSKTDVRARLEALEEMSGVLPTARRSSEQLEEMAQGLESNDMSRAVTASRAYLDDSQMSVAPRDTAHESKHPRCDRRPWGLRVQESAFIMRMNLSGRCLSLTVAAWAAIQA